MQGYRDSVGSRKNYLMGLFWTLLALSISSCAYRQAPHLHYDLVRGIELPAAPDDRAQVIFYLSASPSPEIELAVYDDREQLGLLRYVTWFAALFEPGDHRFAVVSVRSADFTVGRLEAGRTYFLDARHVFDWRFKLEPVTPSMSRFGGPIANFMKGLYHVTPNSLTAAENDRLDASRRALFETYYQKWQKKAEGDRRRITPEHAVSGPISIHLDEPAG